jgi:phosphohistidine phosphatase
MASVDIIFWRHAHAKLIQDDQDDLERPLSAKGEKQAKQMATWLNQRLDKRVVVLASPALRTVQTANALGLEYEIEQEIRLGAEMETILGVISRHLDADENDQQPRQIVLVGHQPWIGQTIGRMLGMRAGVEVKKGAAWWLHSDSDASSPQFRLLASMCPQML